MVIELKAEPSCRPQTECTWKAVLGIEMEENHECRHSEGGPKMVVLVSLHYYNKIPEEISF